jgi:hypothetical protein
MRVGIFYALIAVIFEWVISSWVQSWWQGEDTRIPFYFVMPILFGITLTTVDRWVRSNPLMAVFIGAVSGAISSIIASEVLRLAVIGADRYIHGWRALGWYSSVSSIGFGTLITGGWFLGSIAALGRYFHSRRAGVAFERGGKLG